MEFCLFVQWYRVLSIFSVILSFVFFSSITFFMATGLTTLSFVIEKKEGLLDRSLTAGVSAFEILLAHVFTQLFVLIVQVTLVMVFALAVFEVSVHCLLHLLECQNVFPKYSLWMLPLFCISEEKCMFLAYTVVKVDDISYLHIGLLIFMLSDTSFLSRCPTKAPWSGSFYWCWVKDSVEWP